MNPFLENIHPELIFEKEKHIKYFKNTLKLLPSHYVGMDSSRMTAIHFAVVALDVLDALEDINKNEIIEYIYSLQIKSSTEVYCPHGGFVGSPSIGAVSTEQVYTSNVMGALISGHLAMIYSALVSLTTLQDDLSRVEKSSLLASIRNLQQPNGTFFASINDPESDLRFLYCACAISSILNDWTAVNTESAASYIRQCLTYEGGFALTPEAEAHGGATYCGVAALALMNRLQVLSTLEINNLTRWCLNRQIGGYQGRTNKDADSCYSYWIGASINILEAFQSTHAESTTLFLLGHCQYYNGICIGGFGKIPGAHPDILHSFMSINWLAMTGYPGLKGIYPELGICRDRVTRR